MDMIHSLILGVVQGIAEFLPISSSAHLIIIPWLLGWSEDGGLTFDVALHFGTLIAIIVYFRHEWVHLVKTFFRVGFKGKTSDEKMPWFLILATIPGAIFGLLLEKKAETTFRNPGTIGATLAIMGVMLYLADRFSKRSKNLAQITLQDILLIGFAQGFALVPGVSRAGVTIMVGLLCGLDRESAAKFSFWLAMPITAGACLLKLRHLHGADLTPEFLVGVGAAAVFGFLSIGGLIRFLQKRSYGVFAFYRVVVGIAVIALIALKIKNPSI